MVPPIAVLLTKHPEVAKYDLSSVTVVNCGGAPLGINICKATTKKFNLVDVGRGEN